MQHILINFLNIIFAPGFYFAHYYYEYTKKENTSALGLIALGLALFYIPAILLLLWIIL
jgi:hypothetical protein